MEKKVVTSGPRYGYGEDAGKMTALLGLNVTGCEDDQKRI